MLRPSQSVLAVAGTIFAAGLITLVTPRAVHAVAAALVQVANTASNPVVTQGVGSQAANLVHLSCDVSLNRSTYINCFAVPPTGYDGTRTPYVVPTGQSLVITAADVTPSGPYTTNPCPGSSYHVSLVTASNQTFFTLSPSTSTVTTHFTYPSSGIVIASGIAPLTFGDITASDGLPSGCGIDVDLQVYGYLTSN